MYFSMDNLVDLVNIFNSSDNVLGSYISQSVKIFNQGLISKQDLNDIILTCSSQQALQLRYRIRLLNKKKYSTSELELELARLEECIKLVRSQGEIPTTDPGSTESPTTDPGS